MSALELTLLYLLAAVLGVTLFRWLKLPPMLGYLAVGVVIGPHALALSNNADGVRHLGEFGVVFLMFVIGLEFNLPKLRSMRRHVFGLGLLQVVLSCASHVRIPFFGQYGTHAVEDELANCAGSIGRDCHEQHSNCRQAAV